MSKNANTTLEKSPTRQSVAKTLIMEAQRNLHTPNNGRPTKMTPSTITSLFIAFSMGCTDEEACILAGISHNTLYIYQEKNPEFYDEKMRLKHNPVLLARFNVMESIQPKEEETREQEKERIENSKWVLQRVKKDEFNNALVTINNNDNRKMEIIKDNPQVVETLVKMAEAIKKDTQELVAEKDLPNEENV